MTARISTVLLLAAVIYAQPQDPGPGMEEAAKFAGQLNQSSLPAGEKTELRRALENRDYRAAETILVRQIGSNPKSSDLLLLAARVFMLDKNPANAAIALKKAEKIHPLADSERFMLAMAYLGMQRGAWARPELETLARDNSANPTYLYWLSRIDYDEHKYDSAIHRLQAVIEAQPALMRAWDNLGLTLEAVGSLDEAQACYREAIRLNRGESPHSPWPPLNFATLLTRLGDLKHAEVLIQESILYQGGLAESHYRLGVNLYKQGRLGDAIQQLRKSAEIDPAATGPLYTLGQIYREEGDQAAAGEVFARFRELKKKQRGTDR